MPVVQNKNVIHYVCLPEQMNYSTVVSEKAFTK